MADVPKEKTKVKAAPKTKKAQVAAAPAAAAAAPAPAVNAFAENTVAAPIKETLVTPPDMNAAEETESSLKFCPVCDNYLYMEVDAESKGLTRLCRKCGHKEEDTKGGLVMEMMIQQQSSEGYKILLNEFTRKDPRLPHIRKNISCPNVTCDSNKGGKDPDVIYIKYDLVNLMYLYICDICGEKWHSRDRS
jgi:DNA-directed RNA polymerase subunit M/transcription elongation factor TFIIS